MSGPRGKASGRTGQGKGGQRKTGSKKAPAKAPARKGAAKRPAGGDAPARAPKGEAGERRAPGTETRTPQDAPSVTPPEPVSVAPPGLAASALTGREETSLEDHPIGPEPPEVELPAEPRGAAPEAPGDEAAEFERLARREPIVVELDRQMERLDQTLRKVQDEVAYWARRGFSTRVRFRLRGKQILPDIPVAAFLAAEAATFWWAGLLRSLAANLGGRALLDVELISDAEPHLARGQSHLLAGDVDEAMEAFRQALEVDRNLAPAHLQVGICHKLRGDREAARQAFRRARELDPRGETGRQARAQLDKLG